MKSNKIQTSFKSLCCCEKTTTLKINIWSSVQNTNCWLWQFFSRMLKNITTIKFHIVSPLKNSIASRFISGLFEDKTSGEGKGVLSYSKN